MSAQRKPPRWRVQLSVARSGDWRSWGTISGTFERALAEQAGKSVLAPHIESESRRGRDYVRITLAMTVHAADVAEAVAAAWWVFRKAAGSSGDWDMTGATAEVHPA
jgi:hypothetical protein